MLLGQNLIYYDKDPQGHKIQLETQKILKAVEGVLDGKVSHKYSENFIERMARVCFLRPNTQFIATYLLRDSTETQPFVGGP